MFIITTKKHGRKMYVNPLTGWLLYNQLLIVRVYYRISGD